MAAPIRALQLHDLLAYLAFAKRATRDDGIASLGAPSAPNPWRSLLYQSLLLDPTRQRWVHRDGGQIVASLGVRARPGVDIWEIDECMALPTPAGRMGRLRLLNWLTERAVDEGIQKVFIRVHEASPLEELARQAGFVSYAIERVYGRAPAPNPPTLLPTGLRSRRGADHHGLFRLYMTVVPPRVRQVEAMTLGEWRFVDGWRPARMHWSGGLKLMRSDYVAEREGEIVAWLQLNRRRSLIRHLARSEYAPELPGLIAWAVGQLHAPRGHLAVLRDYQLAGEPALLENGFRLGAEHALLALMLAVRVQEPQLVPVRV